MKLYQTIMTGLFLMGVSQASQSAQTDMSPLIQQAQFIFAGQVQRIEYRLSEPEDNGQRIPYTFVTYSVNRIFKGGYAGAEITLRFFGGPTGEAGKLMISPNYPLFDVNDQDVLLVTGNTANECPLVGCAAGRFRIIQGLVVNEYGQTLSFDKEGQLITGKPIEDNSISEHSIDGQFSLKRHQDDAQLTQEKPSRGTDEVLGDDSYMDIIPQAPASITKYDTSDVSLTPLSENEFLTYVETTIQNSEASHQGYTDVMSANPDQPFFSPGARPEAAPGVSSVYSKAANEITTRNTLSNSTSRDPMPTDYKGDTNTPISHIRNLNGDSFKFSPLLYLVLIIATLTLPTIIFYKIKNKLSCFFN
jgi:hypothetical protein